MKLYELAGVAVLIILFVGFAAGAGNRDLVAGPEKEAAVEKKAEKRCEKKGRWPF